MRLPLLLMIAPVAALTACAALAAQLAPPPGKQDTSLITGGTYNVDGGHTQVVFDYDHMGFTRNMGLIAGANGTLNLDPKAPDKANLTVSFPVSNIRTGIPDLDTHLMKSDFFDAEKFPTATFKSTSVKVAGTEAVISGDMTIKGVTKPVTLHARFTGAGINAMMKKETVGFSAQTEIKRSDFGLGYGVPMVGDAVELRITAAFEK